MADPTAGRSAGTTANPKSDPTRDGDAAAAERDPTRADEPEVGRDPTAGGSAGLSENPEDDPTRGDEAGAPDNPGTDPTR
jgi:hypothetical protein